VPASFQSILGEDAIDAGNLLVMLRASCMKNVQIESMGAPIAPPLHALMRISEPLVEPLDHC
jgi:hypothetical protein